MLTGGDHSSERRQQVADNHLSSMLTGGDHSSEDHSSSMLTGGDGSSERRQQVADHYSSSMLTGGDGSSERRQQVADNHLLSMLTGGDHSSEDYTSSMLTGGDGSSERRQQVADHHLLSMLTGGDHSSEDHSSSMLTGGDGSSERRQQVADNQSLLKADVLSDAFNVLYSGCHLSDSQSALSALPVIMMDTSLLSSVTTLSAIIATSSISDPCLSDCPPTDEPSTTVDADTCVADDEKDPDYVPDNSSGNDSDTTVASAQPPLTKKRRQFKSTVLPSGKYNRPVRPCRFCGRLQTHLSRHLLTSHIHEREISDITDLPHKEKVLVLAKMKKEGILQENRTRLKRSGDPLPLLHEKRQKSPVLY